jgi:hypothetical protein
MAALEVGLMVASGKFAKRLGLLTAEEMLSPGVKAAAERILTAKGLRDRLLGAIVEAGEEGATQFGQQLWGAALGADSMEDLGKNIGRAAVLGFGGAGAVTGIQGVAEAFRTIKDTDWRTILRATKDASQYTGEVPPVTRRAFEKATGRESTSKLYRQAFVDEVNRRLAESPEAENEPEGSFQAALARKPLTPEELTQLRRDYGRARSKLPSSLTEPLDVLLESNPQQLNDIFREAELRTQAENERRSEIQSEYRTLIGSKDRATAILNRARRVERSGGDIDQLAHINEAVEALRSGDYPQLSAEASRLGDGDLEHGLFQLVQGGLQQFEPISIERYLGEVLAESEQAQPATDPSEVESFDVGDSIYKIDFSKIPADATVEIEVIRAKTGERIARRRPAREALQSLNESANLYKQLMACLDS